MQQLWQKLILALYDDFVPFFFSDWSHTIDLERAPTFLSIPKSVVQKRKNTTQENLIIGVRRRDGSAALILFVLEQQGYTNHDFGQQLFRDFSRVLDELEYKMPVAIFTLFLANSLPKELDEYEYRYHNTAINLHYPSYIVREQSLDDLWAMNNPMAFIIAACRMQIEYPYFQKARLNAKIEVTQRAWLFAQKQNLSTVKWKAIAEFTDATINLQDGFQQDYLGWKKSKGVG